MDSNNARDEKLIRAIVEVANGISIPMLTWGPDLVDPACGAPDRMKNRAFPIFIGCVKDVATASVTKIRKLSSEVQVKDDLVFQSNFTEVMLQCTFAMDLIQEFTFEEQIYLNLLRDRFVHGYLDGNTNEQRTFTTIMDKKVQQKTLSISQQEQVVATVQTGTEDAAISKLRLKYAKEVLTYRDEMTQFIGSADSLEQALRNGELVVANRRSSYQKI